MSVLVGSVVSVETNYIRLNSDPDKGVFEYEVRFEPSVHSNGLRHNLVNKHKDIIGNTKTFDGTILYLPIKLVDHITKFTSISEHDNTTYNVTIIYKRQKRMGECMHLYNVLFDRIMKVLNFVKFGRKKFDPTAPKIIPQHKLEVWPGYVTAVDEYEGGVMLCLDVSHRVLCQTSVLDYLRSISNQDDVNFQKDAVTALLGSVVLTRYNNKTYRIDDILFDKSPSDTFNMSGKEVSYVEYYKSHYNINIRDHNQPLLVSMSERRIIGQAEKEQTKSCLIPEISFLTGLTDTMRSDQRLMRDIATLTRVTPNQRVDSFRKFCKSLNTTPAAKEILTDWGLTLNENPISVEGRQLGVEKIKFGRGEVQTATNADFNRDLLKNEVLEAIDINNWLLIYVKTDDKRARAFVDCMMKNSRIMGIEVKKPMLEVLQTDKTELYVQTLRRCIGTGIQIVVIICPTSRDDRYAAIKKVCCCELPIPSQVINSRTLANDEKNRAIVQKIALQMNCKLGGTLWSIKIPFNNVMICGIDTYHDAGSKGNSVSAFVASLNGSYTRWYSRAIIQNKKEELLNGLCASLIAALQAYKAYNNDVLPVKIIIFR